MLDEFGNDLEITESKLDSTMKKVKKFLHISSGKFFNSDFCITILSKRCFLISSFQIVVSGLSLGFYRLYYLL
jgi:hypothetical protein